MNSCVSLCVRYSHILYQTTKLLTRIQYFTAGKEEAFLNNKRKA